MGKSKTVIVKVGTGYLFGDSKSSYYLKEHNWKGLTEEIAGIMYNGIEVALVSSGAVAIGAMEEGLTALPNDVDERAALASVGQGYLIEEYKNRLKEYKIACGQLLVIYEDLYERADSVREVSKILFDKMDLPIYNYNDTVARKETMLDNDIVAAKLGVQLKVKLVVMLSNPVNGLGTGGGKTKKEAKEILDQGGIELKILNGEYELGDSETYEKYGTKYKPKIREVLEDYFN